MVAITKIPNFGKGRIDQGGPRCFCWTDRKLNFYIMSVHFLLMDTCKYDKDVDNEDDIGSHWSAGHLKVHWSGKWSVPHSRSLTNELAVPTFKVSHPQINLNLFLMLINQSTSASSRTSTTNSSSSSSSTSSSSPSSISTSISAYFSTFNLNQSLIRNPLLFISTGTSYCIMLQLNIAKGTTDPFLVLHCNYNGEIG